jgi:type II secretory pathway component PulM
MKSIDNIFAFNIICFSVYTKSISMLLVLDLVVLVLVIAFDLDLDLVLLHQLRVWDFLLFRQQQLILAFGLVLVLVFVLVFFFARVQNQLDVWRFLSLISFLLNYSVLFSPSLVRIEKSRERWTSQRFVVFYFQRLRNVHEIESSGFCNQQ